eukprot:gb/GFBE01008559.1/.p1 GENE.gb/GFBE01008559.1/~~gb/GFBE01008559.1/.p1  ORF type:complete len:105 (+),score=20.64 gb/GFBE01008559.1/:1-315(+)
MLCFRSPARLCLHSTCMLCREAQLSGLGSPICEHNSCKRRHTSMSQPTSSARQQLAMAHRSGDAVPPSCENRLAEYSASVANHLADALLHQVSGSKFCVQQCSP